MDLEYFTPSYFTPMALNSFVDWYCLPHIIPYDVRVLIVEYTFDPFVDPW